MAARNRTHTHRHDEAQPANHHGDSDPDPARKARAQLRRAKETARYQIHEYAIRATDSGERAGPGIGDRQGEVA